VKTKTLPLFESIVPDADSATVPRQKRRKSPDGVSTANLVFSAYIGTNAEVFPLVLSLHVPQGSVVADVTYSKGIFWQNVPKDKSSSKATRARTTRTFSFLLKRMDASQRQSHENDDFR